MIWLGFDVEGRVDARFVVMFGWFVAKWEFVFETCTVLEEVERERKKRMWERRPSFISR